MSIDTTPAKTAIRTAYAALQKTDNDWVRFAKLRPIAEQQMMDDGVDLCMVRGLFNRAVIEMERADEFIPAPDSNTKALDDTDRRNAVQIGARTCHLIAQQIQD